MLTLELTQELIDEATANGQSKSWKTQILSAGKMLAAVAPTTDDYDKAHWIALRETIEEEDWGEKYTAYRTNTARRIVRRAIDRDLVPESALRFFPRFTARLTPQPTCTDEEANAMVNGAKYVQTKAAILLGYDAGLRCSEAANLRVEDIDFTRDVIHIKRRKGGDYGVVPILTDRLRDALKVAVERVPPHGYIARTGRAREHPKRPHQYQKIRDLCRRVGIRELTFHSLRRGFATWSATRGLDGTPASLPAISKAMGHANLEMTRHYIEKVIGNVAEDIRRDYHGVQAPIPKQTRLPGTRPWSAPPRP